MDQIIIKGAREHNLKNVDLTIPKNKLVVFTGLSGSGKSSLAFDTIYAEGQRRYVESLSSYARQFLGLMSKPDVDSIDGLSPAISIDQKTTSHNPRSTVGTITEIYDYLRLLFARVGHPHCPNCGREISQQSTDQIVSSMLDLIKEQLAKTPVIRLAILAPVVRDKKGEFTSLLDNLSAKGFAMARIDNHFIDLSDDIVLIKTNKHSISAVVQRITFDSKSLKSDSLVAELKSRLFHAVETALNLTNGLVIATQVKDVGLDFPKKPEDTVDHLYSEQFACPQCNISLPEIEPRIFSFNSPHGACPTCNGLGSLLKIDSDKIVAPEISLSEGAIIPFASILTHDTWYGRLIKTVVGAYQESLKTPFKDLPENLQQILLHGDDPSRVYTVYGQNRFGRDTSYDTTFEGFVTNLQRRYSETKSEFMRHEIERFMSKTLCPDCHGDRLKPTALAITINGANIAQATALSISDTLGWTKDLKTILSDKENHIAELIIKELITRLDFLVSVGLEYLTLNREAGSLSGGEAQRIRLASQIGTGLSGVLYVLDEPTIGLHQHDNARLVKTLRHLRDLGNTVLVVEHDHDTIAAADHIVDFGPLAGKHGGVVVAQGSLDQIIKNKASLTGQYLAGKKKVFVDQSKLPKNENNPRSGTDLQSLTITGCTLHNLRNLTVSFPLGKLITITGLSGSGKSTLMHDSLYRALRESLNSGQIKGDYCQALEGYQEVSKVSLIDQSPIGRTPRSNPATYTKIFDLIRQVFALSPQARERGFKPGRFSFNVKGGRCESCQGEGQVKIEMQFLPDIYVTCDVCHGTRYNSETLQCLYKGKNISEVLNLTIEDALEFFHNHPGIKHKLGVVHDVGLGYIELGQPAPTLSGGEAQRVKLAKELSVKSTGHCVYLLDEPTTGLHFQDSQKLLQVLYRLVNQGNTVILIEHNLDIIKNSQHIIDLGPQGGENGGDLIAVGSPADIAGHPKSYTGQFLKKIL